MNRTISPAELAVLLENKAALDKLRALGFTARFIEGGMDGWKAAGGALAMKQ